MLLTYNMNIITLDDSQKVEILKVALEERYRSIHAIRERVQSMCIWSMGLLLAAMGWLIQGNFILNTEQKILYSLFILIIFSIIRFSYLRDLSRGFSGQQKAAAHIEKMLGLYQQDLYIQGETVYPIGWENAGNDTGKGNFFRTSFYLLYAGVVLVIVVMCLKGGIFTLHF